MKIGIKLIVVLLVVLLIYISMPFLSTEIPLLDKEMQTKVHASSQYSPTFGNLIVGSNTATSLSNTGSWQGTLGSDDNYWTVNRIAASTSLDLSIEFSGVNLMNANKIIITVEDSNITTATGYVHQICDWTLDTGHDSDSDTICNGAGGWRTLQPRKTAYTTTSDTSRVYEIYNGYFWDTTTSPGTVIPTPLTNFIQSGTNKVIVRTFSTVNATTQYRLDAMQLEVAIDPVYEPADYVKTAGGSVTGKISDLIGAVSSGVNGSDGNKVTVPMSGNSVAIDHYFSFKNVRMFSGTDTILVEPEICVSNVALTFTVYLYNFQTSAWTPIGNTITGSGCTTDTDYAFSFNSATIPGFDINNYISSNEVRFRILTNAPASTYNMQLDRIYMMLGAVNSNTAACEISWGTGTATDCANTRKIYENKAVAPTVSTWQATAALEYPSSYYSLDNDDDTNNSEYATSQNLSFPMTVSDNMSVTAIHYSAKYRSNSTAQTADLQIRDYSGQNGTSGWINTPGTDTNALTTYGWFDTWNLVEYQGTVKDNVDTVDNLMNLRLRTSAGTTTNPGTRDWAFAMMSIRWVEETNRVTLLSKFTPTSGYLAPDAGSEVATDLANTGSWKGALGNDNGTSGSGNYWTTARSNPGGLNKQLIFDGVELYGANKIILTFEDGNITTGDAYLHQICDWNNPDGVNNDADTECTGGGWRTLNERLTAYTYTNDTTKVYEIYDGYFSSRTTTPGTAYSTPMSNFVRAANKRVLVREYSTVNSVTQLRTDFVSVEPAIDPVYEPTAYIPIAPFAGTTSGFYSDLIGASGSNGSKFLITNTATNPMNFYYSFKNVQTYPGMNTIVIKPEICVTNAALTFDVWLYNFTLEDWGKVNISTITGTVCSTDTPYAFAENNININDFIRSGEIRVRFSTAVTNTYNFQMDRIYIILGSTNTNTADCEISWGTGTQADCINTRDVADVETGSTANTPTWQTTSVLEYPATYYSLDNDDDANNAEAAYAANINFPITVTSGMSVTALHFAGRFRSNTSTITQSLAAKDYGGRTGTSGWTNVGATNALTTYVWTDSWQSAELQNVPYFYLDTYDNEANLRLRTTASTNTVGGTINDWDFAMASIRWVQAPTGTVYADIVDDNDNTVTSPSINFNSVDTTFECQTTTATFGTSAQKIRIYNSSENPQWTLSLSATNGSDSNWSAGTPKYDFNDSSGSPAGCTDGSDTDAYAGRLSLDFSSAVITPAEGCSTSGISLGSNASFNEEEVDSITLAQASGSAGTSCYWDITNILVSQKIPADQLSGNYNINMSLSVVTN